MLSQAPPVDDTRYARDLLLATLLGAALKTLGDSFYKPYLESRGYKEKVVTLTAQVAEIQRHADEREARIVLLEAAAAREAVERRELTQAVAELSLNLLAVRGEIKDAPGTIPDPSPSPAHGLAALVVEDDPSASLATGHLLRKYGFRVASAFSRAEALQAVGAAKLPDVVLLDLTLPDGDGADVLRAVRDARLPVRVVVLTGKDEATLAGVRDLGPDAVLHKPYELGALLTSLTGTTPVDPIPTPTEPRA